MNTPSQPTNLNPPPRQGGSFADVVDRRRTAMTVSWKTEPDDHDYPAAGDYLALIADQAAVKKLVAQLKSAPIVYKKAEDILRASRLRLLPVDNPHVKSDLAKIAKNIALPPILLVRGDITTGVPLQVADGYHRVCASYDTDENTDIPSRIAWPKPLGSQRQRRRLTIGDVGARWGPIFADGPQWVATKSSSRLLTRE
jgi:hypothetical protein